MGSNSAISTPTFQAVNANITNDGTADSPRGYAVSTDSNITMTISNTRVFVTAVTASRTVTLPTTSVKAGMVVDVQTACTSPYTIAINSSGANLIDTLKGTKGKISLMALQDAPTTAAHWRVMDVYDEGSIAYSELVFSASGGGTVTIESGDLTNASFTRNGRILKLDITISSFTVAGTVTSVNIELPVGFRTGAGDNHVPTVVFDSTGSAFGVGMAFINPGEKILRVRRPANSAWTATTNGSYFYINGSYLTN